ncbi:hypothetical protein BDN70DRAFT_901571 [Pholiota conissans]|uniref:Uncharacterized protein n=1 Tax=Pholiota conissans TaxID=109636 RepID=A0A9P5YL70_9AGAR|nr:hypothetical protein BDN70DRAFT_901571 [Pholiota conissans]
MHLLHFVSLLLNLLERHTGGDDTPQVVGHKIKATYRQWTQVQATWLESAIDLGIKESMAGNVFKDALYFFSVKRQENEFSLLKIIKYGKLADFLIPGTITLSAAAMRSRRETHIDGRLPSTPKTDDFVDSGDASFDDSGFNGLSNGTIDDINGADTNNSSFDGGGKSLFGTGAHVGTDDMGDDSLNCAITADATDGLGKRTGSMIPMTVWTTAAMPPLIVQTIPRIGDRPFGG